jgi:branched-subunit amino acid aminotransferase/4-amino-4-deoxychorismate lyase
LFNLNGTISTSDIITLPEHSTAFRQGCSLIETMRFDGYRIPLFDRHWQRLSTGLQQLQWTAPFNQQELQSEIEKLTAAAAQVLPAVIRLQTFDTGKKYTEFVISCRPVQVAAKEPWKLHLCRDVCKPHDLYAHLKTGSRLPYVIAMKQAQEQGCDDALLLNQYGRICESTLANIFGWKDNVLHTPPLTEGCVAGVMRSAIIDYAIKNEISIVEAAFNPEGLEQWDELFLSNAVRGIIPVAGIGNQVYSGTRTALLAEGIGQDKEI